jgi:hypothetical protein
MQTLCDAIKIRKIIIRAVDPEERIKRFTPRRSVLRDPEPQLLGLGREVPLRREPG